MIVLVPFPRACFTFIRPTPQIKMSPTPARTMLSIVIFLAGSVRREKKREFYQSKADTAPPPAPTVRSPRNRKGGPGARASWGIEP